MPSKYTELRQKVLTNKPENFHELMGYVAEAYENGGIDWSEYIELYEMSKQIGGVNNK